MVVVPALATEASHHRLPETERRAHGWCVG